VTYWDIFQSLLSQIAHEDNLLISRTNWLLASQFLLLIGYVSIDKKKLPLEWLLDYYRVICVAGVVSTIFIFSAILASVKVFVQIRTTMYSLLAQHPDLPMRELPYVGIGAGLLCPILLSLSILFIWSLFTCGSWWAAILMAISGSLFSMYVVGKAHDLHASPYQAFLVGLSFPAALCFLVVAILVGVHSVKRSRRMYSPSA
jgi:hypothetical protein